MHLCLTICTRRRPKMLQNLLDSLCALKSEPNLMFSIIVLENDSSKNCQKLVGSYSDRLSISYQQEPRAGLVFARNAAINAFLQTDADFMGFVDDDELLDSNWLCAFSSAISAYGSDNAYWGILDYSENQSLPGWYPKLGNRKLPTGSKRNSGATNNIILPRRVVSAEGMNLRFDQRYNFTGGEDGNFFARAMREGLKVLNVNEAIIHTQPNPERLQFGYIFKRLIRVTQFMGHEKRIRYGYLGGIGYRLLYVYGCLIRTVLFMLKGLVLLPFREKVALESIGHGFSNIARMLGALKSFFGLPGETYRETDGH